MRKLLRQSLVALRVIFLIRVYPRIQFKKNTSLVKYIDYEKDVIKGENKFLPFVHKRKRFQHEKELRLFIRKQNERKIHTRSG